MDNTKQEFQTVRFIPFITVALLTITAFVTLQLFQVEGSSPPIRTHPLGWLRLSIPYHAAHAGTGRLKMEVLDPEDRVLGIPERQMNVSAGQGLWQDEIKLAKPLPLEDLVWHRVRYHFEYDDVKLAGLEGTESISQILRRPVIRILGQQSYLSGSLAAVRVIVTDSQNEVIAGRGVVQIELLGSGEKPKRLFTGRLNRHGTIEAQFRFPAAAVGNYQLHYIVDSPIGSTEFTQAVRF